MTTLVEKDLQFTFPSTWKAEVFDLAGRDFPRGVLPVDFVVERADDILLIEVKDPSNPGATTTERERFAGIMRSDELTHQQLVPKARTSWSYLHLMGRVTKPLRYIAVIGIDAMSVQPVLMQNLGDRLQKRLAQEVSTPWAIPYVVSSIVVPALELSKYLTGVTVVRVSGGP